MSDADARLRRRERDIVRRLHVDEDFQASLAKEIGRMFPGCPPERAAAIAAHTGVRGSGRHQDTKYDSLLMDGVSRDEARERVRPAIDRVLAAWTAHESQW